MLKDQFGLPASVDAPAALQGYDAYVSAFLSYGADIRAVFETADRHPEWAFVNAHAAVLHMAFEGREGFASSKPYLTRALQRESSANPRERQFISVAKCWSECDFEGALDALETLLAEWPEDLCALKWAQYHAFNLGDTERMLRILGRAMPAHEGRPYAHGLMAFAYELNHRLEEAEQEGLRAVEIRVDDAWAQHAVAHVMDAQGRHEDGAAWLAHCAHTWEGKGVFIRDHNWWHAALFQLALGAHTKAIEIYDSKLWGEWPEFPQEQIGAISMLWRLEMRGAEVGERWSPVVEQARARAGEHILPFHDLHYLYALARAGRPSEAEAFSASLRKKADACGAAWARAAVPAGAAILAYARGDWENAVQRFSVALPALQAVGGSHAQRAVFVEAAEFSLANLRGSNPLSQAQV